MRFNTKSLNKKLRTEELAIEAQAGDRIAMNLLLERWYPRIYHFVLRNIFNDVEAREVSQQTMSSVFKNIGGLRDVSKFKFWIYRIARNECHTFHRKQRRFYSLETEQVQSMESLESSVEDSIIQRERRDNVIAALRKIPGKQREVVVMKVYEDLKFHEIAEILDISENTAKSRMYYGLTALKKQLLKSPTIKETYYE